MKKGLVAFLVTLIFLIGTCQAASYTLPEKMHNQLAIGSGLKGTFHVSAEGDKFDTPFLKAVTDADFSLRGITSGKDLHYYLFQSDDTDQQTALSELYRKEGHYYFRSDMVQGKVLSFPTADLILESLFPSEGENPSPASFITKIFSVPENERSDKWEPVLNRYQNELEMWLADFTVQAEMVKLSTGFSALDFSYEIPVNEVSQRIVKLFAEFASDTEFSALLDSVMTAEEKKTYLNSNLLYFYQEALNSLDLNSPVRMNKRVSAMGEVLSFRLELPLDERSAGYSSVSIENVNNLTVYTLKNSSQVIVLGWPSQFDNSQNEWSHTFWFSRVSSDSANSEENQNTSVRIDIQKTNEAYNDEEEKSHETNHYTVTVIQDDTYLPSDTDRSLIPEFETVNADLDLHYYSKYAQNSATTLDVKGDLYQGSSSLHVTGKLKTAAPWLFMPFDVNDPIPVGTTKEDVLVPYLEEWISNASSMIHHKPADSSAAEAVPAAAE